MAACPARHRFGRVRPQRLAELALLGRGAEATDPASVTAELIGIRDVSKRFGRVQALRGVTCDVDAPATGLLGANGAGKSTLMRIMLGLVGADAGSVSIFGLDAHRDADQIRRLVGYMPEHECLPREMTASDLVVQLAELRGLPRRQAVLRASEVLFQVGLDEERSRPIGTFSTGMRQRTKLAQALVHGPRLVLADEPTNGLDPSGRVEMLALIRRLSNELGVRVIVSSHLLDDIRRTCDAVLCLRDGELVLAAPLSAFDAASGTLRVRILGDAAAFQDALRAAGIEATRRDHDTLVVAADGDDALRGVRDAACVAGVGLRELAPDAPTTEDLLVDVLGEGSV